MSEGVLWLLVVLAVAITIASWMLGAKWERERREALARLARARGWSFSGEHEDEAFPERHAGFDCFQRGHSRYAHNQMVGAVACFGATAEAELGDFHYKITRRSGKSSSTTTYRFSYMLVTLPFASRVPDLALRTEGVFDKLAGAIGFEDIDFESAEFSRRYHVSGTNRRFVYDLFHPRMIDWMLDEPPPQLAITGGTLLIVSNDGQDRWEPADFVAAIRWMESFLARWPDYLVRDLAAR